MASAEYFDHTGWLFPQGAIRLAHLAWYFEMLGIGHLRFFEQLSPCNVLVDEVLKLCRDGIDLGFPGFRRI